MMAEYGNPEVIREPVTSMAQVFKSATTVMYCKY